jgi:hypothetical protein
MYNPNERGIRNPAAHPAGAAGNPATGQGGLTYGQSAASGPAPTTAGHHRHDILNKLDPRVDSTHDRQPMSQTTSSIPEGTYGPHSSRLANALDPRVDSDLDSTRAGAGQGAGGGLGGGAAAAGGPAPPPAAGMQGAAASGAPSYTGRGVVAGGGVPERTYGPHTSRVANALDPRVDSDRDRHVGPGATRAPGGAFGGSSTTAAGSGAGAGTGHGVSAPHTAGPHKSDLLNKLDPRVDSKTGAWKGGSGSRGAY